MHRRVRVLLVTPRFAPYTGGVETHVREVSRRLVAEGLDVTVLTTDPSRSLPDREEIDGVSVRRVPAWPRGRDYHFAPAVHRIVARGGWDAVHVQSYHTLVAPLAMNAARQAGTPYVVTFHAGGHSSGLRNAMRGLQLETLRPLLVRAARLVALARFEIEEYSRRLRVPADRFVLIPNGSDLPPVDVPAVREGPPVIASVGRLERYKGHHRVIAALPHVLRHEPDARLWIAGAGPYESELRTRAAAAGVSDRVDIEAYGPDARAAFAGRLAGSAVAVLASEFETHPIAAIEAAALGLPVLVGGCAALRELAADGLARLADVDDPEALATAIVAEIRTPTRPSGVVLPTWDDCAAKLADLYRTIAA